LIGLGSSCISEPVSEPPRLPVLDCEQAEGILDTLFSPEGYSRLGSGGEGQVFKGIDRHTGYTVAIKVPTSAAFETPNKLDTLRIRFAAQAEAISEIRGRRHPGARYLVPVDYLETEEGPALYMPVISGTSLDQMEGKLAPAKILDLALQITQAVEAVHEANFVHRDIKLENIILTPYGEIRLIDFGFVAPRGAPYVDGGGVITKKRIVAHPMAGTRGHQPGDQLKQEGFVGSHSDVYAIAYSIERMLLPVQDVPESSTYSVLSPLGKFEELRLSPYTHRKEQISSGKIKPGAPKDEAQFEMLSSISRARESFRDISQLKSLLSAVGPHAEKLTTDDWYRKYYFPLLAEGQLSGQITFKKMVQIIFSDQAASERLLEGKSGYSSFVARMIVNNAALISDPPTEHITQPVFQMSPYVVPDSIEKARTK